MTLTKATIADRLNAVESNGQPTDLYRVYASHILGKSYETVTEFERQAAKRQAYKLMYSQPQATK